MEAALKQRQPSCLRHCPTKAARHGRRDADRPTRLYGEGRPNRAAFAIFRYYVGNEKDGSKRLIASKRAPRRRSLRHPNPDRA